MKIDEIVKLIPDFYSLNVNTQQAIIEIANLSSPPQQGEGKRKSAEEIRNEYAKEIGFDTWEDLKWQTTERMMYVYLNEVMERYASQSPAIGYSEKQMEDCWDMSRVNDAIGGDTFKDYIKTIKPLEAPVGQITDEEIEQKARLEILGKDLVAVDMRIGFKYGYKQALTDHQLNTNSK